MIGLLFQAWFILFISLYLYFNSAQPVLVKELSINTVILASFFFLWQKKKIKDIQSYLFIISSLSLILYSIMTGIYFLPDSIILRQKLYIRFIFYISIGIFFLLYKNGMNKRVLVFYVVIASSHIYIYRYHYSSIAILFYLVANLYLLDKFSLNKKNVFDLLVFLLFTASVFSTYTSFYYNGTNSVFGFFHLFSGILLYLYFKYIEEEDILHIIRYNHLFYGISLVLFFIFILIYLFSNNPNVNFNLNIAGFHVSNIGSIVAVNFPAIIVMYLFFKDKYKYIYLGLSLLSLVILFFTHSRASTLGVIVSSLFILIYFLKKEKESWKKLFPVVIFLFGFILIFIGKKIVRSDIFNTNSLFARTSIWQAYIERVFHHSIVFGFGSNNEFFNTFLPIDYLTEKIAGELHYYLEHFQANPHAHNLYIQFFYNYGLYGFLILAGVVYFTFLLLIKKVLHGNLVLKELLAFSVLLSIFFQEIFDYTMVDAMTFFPTVVALGIISRYSLSTHSIYNLKYVSIINIKFIYGFQFCIAFFISLLGFNLCIAENEKMLFKNELIIDNFSNLKFKDFANLSEEKLKKFRILDKFYIPINLDDKKEQFSGQIYLEVYKITKEKRDVDLAEKNFQKCIFIFPNSAVCYKRLEEIELLRNNQDEANSYHKKYKENDPFGLVH